MFTPIDLIIWIYWIYALLILVEKKEKLKKLKKYSVSEAFVNNDIVNYFSLFKKTIDSFLKF